MNFFQGGLASACFCSCQAPTEAWFCAASALPALSAPAGMAERRFQQSSSLPAAGRETANACACLDLHCRHASKKRLFKSQKRSPPAACDLKAYHRGAGLRSFPADHLPLEERLRLPASFKAIARTAPEQPQGGKPFRAHARGQAPCRQDAPGRIGGARPAEMAKNCPQFIDISLGSSIISFAIYACPPARTRIPEQEPMPAGLTCEAGTRP